VGTAEVTVDATVTVTIITVTDITVTNSPLTGLKPCPHNLRK